MDGVVTTKPSLTEAAHKNGMLGLLRVFIQNSRSVRRAIQLAQRCHPDALDVLPGSVVPEVIPDLKANLSQHIIAGVLVRRESQVRDLLRAGCGGVGTTAAELWALNRAS